MNIDSRRLQALHQIIGDFAEGFDFGRSQELAAALGMTVHASYEDAQMTKHYACSRRHHLEPPFNQMSPEHGFPKLLCYCHETLSFIFGEKGHSIQFFETVRSPGNGHWTNRSISEHVCSISVAGSIFGPERTTQSRAYADALLQYGKSNALLHAFVGVLAHDSIRTVMRTAA